MAKTKSPADLQIWDVMAAVDRKDYNFYDRLTEEQKKKLSPFLLLKWGASVQGNVIDGYYVVSTNEHVNQNFFSISKHKKLQWQLLCTISPGMGTQKHYWLGNQKKNEINELKKYLMENTKYREDEINILMKIHTEEELWQLMGVQK